MTTASKKTSDTRNPSAVRRIQWLVTGAALVMCAAGAQASDATTQLTVRYQDLNLTQQAETTQLYTRLQRAAARVCRSYERLSVSQIIEERACYDQALSDAVARVGNSSLAALHRDKGALRLAQSVSADQPRS